jgi:predicted Zn-dependent protease
MEHPLGDLERGAAVLRSDLDLLVDTTLPFEPATAPCSPEGVPAGRVALIRGGRLASLLLDRERGARLGRPPTPAPRGRPAAVLASSEPALARDAALALLGDGAVVRTVLGLHTQAARRGEYAVVAPEAHVVRAGRPGGRCAIRLRGNLFEQLAATTTRLVRCRDSATPGLLVLDGIDARPG